AYESYFQHLDRAGGFFYERWGDAPIHSIAATLFLEKGQIHWFEDIGYRHPGNMHCPRDAAMQAKCICDPNKAYTYRSACQTRFAKVNNMAKERMLELINLSEGEYHSTEMTAKEGASENK
ncbi:alpha-1,2-mannosyltransferase ktr1, partial [Coemansia thaxteri]